MGFNGMQGNMGMLGQMGDFMPVKSPPLPPPPAPPPFLIRQKTACSSKGHSAIIRFEIRSGSLHRTNLRANIDYHWSRHQCSTHILIMQGMGRMGEMGIRGGAGPGMGFQPPRQPLKLRPCRECEPTPFQSPCLFY